MKKDWKYILYVSLAFALVVIVRLLSPAQLDWTVTLAHDDKNPYGTYALDQLLQNIFPGKTIQHSSLTLYELKDSLHRPGNILILTQSFSMEDADAKALLRHVDNGGTAFIAANYFSGTVADTLNLNSYDTFMPNIGNDSSLLHFTNAALDTTTRYSYREYDTKNYFISFDTTRTTVIARNQSGHPITIRVQWGKGHLILNNTPLVFTNYHILANPNHEFAATTLSHMPQQDVQWTEFYHLGRREIQTPLRVILTSEPLSWAYYLTLAAIILFMLFEMKRKQRIIPIQQPLANTTLEFVGTIGNLYYHNNDHKNIAEKRIAFLLESIRARYHVNTQMRDDAFFKTLSRKTGRPEEYIRQLFAIIDTISQSPKISTQQLMELNKIIEDFNNTTLNA